MVSSSRISESCDNCLRLNDSRLINDERLTSFCKGNAYIPRFKISKWKEKRIERSYKILLEKAEFIFPSNLTKLDFHSARYFNLT